MYRLTEQGKQECERYITELKAKQKEILDAGIDTITKTVLPSVENIEEDMQDEVSDNSYIRSWGVTDHYEADCPIMLEKGKDFTLIIPENDEDISKEIQSRFDNAIENDEDELDFYTEMLEIGMDVEIVRKYMGDDIAKHMEKFCKEHGLI